MRFLYARRTGRADAVRAAKTLIAEDGALALYPGPAALVAAEGAVVCANEAARAIEALDGLAAAVADALAAGAARTVTLTVPADDAEIEFSVLPLSKGTHALVLGRAVRVARERAELRVVRDSERAA